MPENVAKVLIWRWLLRFDFNRKPVHTHKIVNFENFLKLKFSATHSLCVNCSPNSRSTANESIFVIAAAKAGSPLSIKATTPRDERL